MADHAAHPPRDRQGEVLTEEAKAAAAALERGRLLFAGPCDFVWGATSLDQLPPPDLPEIAFAGRSNVGKSSLINALTGRTTLARVSKTPGRTQQINFFDLGRGLRLVDLPGYGFAKVSKDKVADWVALTDRFLAGRPNLRRVLLLIDSRHGAKAPDHAAMSLLDQAAVSYQAVLTKTDKLSPAEQAAAQDSLAQALRPHVAAHPEILVTSAESGTGIEHVRALLAGLGKPPSMG